MYSPLVMTMGGKTFSDEILERIKAATRRLDLLIGDLMTYSRVAQVDVTLEADVTNGRLISFIEQHARVSDRTFNDGRIEIQAVMGKKMLADLSNNDQVEVKRVLPLSPVIRGEAG